MYFERTRSNIKEYVSDGSIYRWDPNLQEKYSIHADGARTSQFFYCGDFLNPGPPYQAETPFELLKTQEVAPRISALRPKSVGGKRWERHAYRNGERSNRPLVGEDYLVTEMYKKINPNVPIVDIPLFLFELREVPRMVRDLGRVLSGQARTSDIPGSNIALQFGWRPLVNDLHSLVNLASEMDRTAKTLRETVKWKKRLRVSLPPESFAWNLDPKRFSFENYAYMMYQVQYSYERKNWATLRVSPDFTDQYWDMSGFQRAQQALGLRNVSYSTLWNAFPWSWLIDYFLNVGSYLEATRGVLPFTVNSCCIMTQDDYTIRTVLVDKHEVAYYSISHEDGLIAGKWRSRFTRVLPKATVSYQPNPVAGKGGILTSLFAAKALRSLGV